jgi:hypothetical protein
MKGNLVVEDGIEKGTAHASLVVAVVDRFPPADLVFERELITIYKPTWALTLQNKNGRFQVELEIDTFDGAMLKLEIKSSMPLPSHADKPPCMTPRDRFSRCLQTTRAATGVSAARGRCQMSSRRLHRT